MRWMSEAPPPPSPPLHLAKHTKRSRGAGDEGVYAQVTRVYMRTSLLNTILPLQQLYNNAAHTLHDCHLHYTWSEQVLLVWFLYLNNDF